jgi:CheY-like chemotaxis protein
MIWGAAASRGPGRTALALTAFARTEDRRRSLMTGFQTHVPKPIEPAELATVVANLTGRNSAR